MRRVSVKILGSAHLWFNAGLRGSERDFSGGGSPILRAKIIRAMKQWIFSGARLGVLGFLAAPLLRAQNPDELLAVRFPARHGYVNWPAAPPFPTGRIDGSSNAISQTADGRRHRLEAVPLTKQKIREKAVGQRPLLDPTDRNFESSLANRRSACGISPLSR